MAYNVAFISAHAFLKSMEKYSSIGIFMQDISCKIRRITSASALLFCILGLSACLSTALLRSEPASSQHANSSGTPSGTQSTNATSPASSPATPAISTSGSASQWNDAAYAWRLGNFERAENLYKDLSESTSLSSAEKTEALQRLALAATHNNRPHSALDALEKWQKSTPEAEQSPLWQDAWLRSVHTLSPSAAQDHAQKLWNQGMSSESSRAMAAMTLMGQGWDAEQSMQALPLMADFYAEQDMLRKQNLERIVAKEVKNIPDSTLLALSQKIVDSKVYTFPANIILLEDGRRGLGLNKELLAQVQNSAQYADKNIAQNILSGASVGEVNFASRGIDTASGTTQASGTVSPASTGAQNNAHLSGIPLAGIPQGGTAQEQNICLVLALPQSGAIASISQKVRQGADAAVLALNGAGRQLELRHINTSQSSWLSELQQLPFHCAVVGGPIEAQTLTLAKSNGATVQRNFITFLPSLEGYDEGAVAWRLFPSPQDQVDAVLSFSRQLGITDFGSFFPADTYGTRMNGTFTAAVRASGATVRAEGYTGSGTSVWNKAAQSLLQPRTVGNTLLSTATFQAVFMPDSWKNMDGILHAFTQQGEERQVLLGTTIWGQSFMQPPAQTSKWGLAVFPSPFNPKQKPAALQSLPDADMWTALGYDFVQVGAGLGLSTVAQPTTMNAKLQSLQGVKWSMAPVRWNAQGIASQDLMLFTFDSQGVTLADPNVINQRRAEAITRYDALNSAMQ